jgi:PAS domain S-box-containing protein
MNVRTSVRRWLPFTVLAVAVIVTVIASYYVRASVETRDRLRLANHVTTTQRSIAEKIDAQISLLRAGAAFLTTSRNVSRDDFHDFVARLDLQRHYPGVQGIGYSVRIPANRADSLVAAIRRQGEPGFGIYPESPRRDELHAVVYLEPGDLRNRAAIGFDMHSEPTRREAMDRARDAGMPALTRRVRLRQEIDTNVQNGFLIYVPVYQTPTVPASLEARRRSLRGFVYSPLRAGDLFSGIGEAGPGSRVDFAVFDGPSPRSSGLLFDSRSGDRLLTEPSIYSDTVELPLAGQRWSVVVSTRPAFEAISGREQVLLVFIAGLILSIVLFIVTRAEAEAREDAERNAASLARSEEALRESEGRFRAIFNQAAVGIAETDLDGRFVIVNRRFGEIVGYEPEELIGRPYATISLEEDASQSYERMRALVASGEPFNLTRRYRHRDGHVVWTMVSASLMRDAAGEPSNIAIAVEDVTARRIAEEALRESELRLRSLVESNIFGVASGEYGGAVSYANDYFLSMIGYDRAALDRGEIRWDLLATPSGPDIMRVATARLARDHVVDPLETEFLRRDGSIVPTLVGSALLAETLTSGSRVIAFCLDLTERRRADRELMSAKEAAERANMAKDRFLAVLSHELRTPLTPVMAALETFDADALTPQQRSMLEIVRRNVSLEARLIDDLLDLTRIANGKLKLYFEPVDVHRIVHETLEIVDEIAAKRIDVYLHLDALNHVVSGDSARLQQVLWNLVRNAARYTNAGGIVEISTRDLDGRLAISVSDNGVGISAKDLEVIFNAFEQGEKSGQRHGGLGLGLAISRMLVELHGGTIDAASEGEGRGATFTVALPLVEEQNVREGAERIEREPAPASGGTRVLLVDDHHDTRRVLEVLLRQYGYQVTTADSVASALAAAREPFDVLVSDIGLPDGTGYDLLANLRQRGTIRAIALSGFGMEEDLARSRSAGFAEHLTKPVDIKRLHDAIDQLIETVQSRHTP